MGQADSCRPDSCRPAPLPISRLLRRLGTSPLLSAKPGTYEPAHFLWAKLTPVSRFPIGQAHSCGPPCILGKFLWAKPTPVGRPLLWPVLSASPPADFAPSEATRHKLTPVSRFPIGQAHSCGPASPVARTLGQPPADFAPSEATRHKLTPVSRFPMGQADSCQQISYRPSRVLSASPFLSTILLVLRFFHRISRF
jgi:hypothetical protein